MWGQHILSVSKFTKESLYVQKKNPKPVAEDLYEVSFFSLQLYKINTVAKLLYKNPLITHSRITRQAFWDGEQHSPPSIRSKEWTKQQQQNLWLWSQMETWTYVLLPWPRTEKEVSLQILKNCRKKPHFLQPVFWDAELVSFEMVAVCIKVCRISHLLLCLV